MDQEQFKALVEKLEIQAREHPARYQRKVLLLALLGNGYIGLMLLLIVALLVALVLSIVILKALAIKLIIVVGAFLLVLLKAIWVKQMPPTGEEVSSQEAPELFSMIETVRQALNAPRFHHVLITDDFNAAVVRLPRLGVFGWNSNYLLLGLPLMKLLSVDQFHAVLAHEFGHLAKNHSRMSHWVYAQRQRWMQILDVLEQSQSSVLFMFKPFLKWFAPYFNAYSFPMARADEYEADRVSARLTSPQAAAQALTSVNVADGYLHQFYWPSIHKQADLQPQPNFVPFCNMGHVIHQKLNEVDTQKWLEQALKRQTDVADTHPSLSDRLKALNAAPCFNPPAPELAADRLLGQARERIVQNFDLGWQHNIRDAWQRRYQEVQQDKQALAALEGRLARGDVLSMSEMMQRAFLTESVLDLPEEALAQLMSLYQYDEDNVELCYALACRLLQRDDEEGVLLMEKAMAQDELLQLPGCELLRDYYWRIEQQEQAHQWHERYATQAEKHHAASLERNSISRQDEVMRHGLSEAELDKLKAQLSEISHLTEVYLVRKSVKHFPQQPCYILAFKVNGFFQGKIDKRVVEAMSLIQTMTFPGETLIINIQGDNRYLAKLFTTMADARVL